MQFFEKVKFARVKLNLTQRQLAKALNVSFVTVNRWENSQVMPRPLAEKTFYDFCENNFVVFE